ncbi:hypothetical protein [Gemmatimonas sp.]|uniref:hypothetical protein n=1 Tax=Gemmatimonas sp. TaxID=1962908 RepID=UPI003983407E
MRGGVERQPFGARQLEAVLVRLVPSSDWIVGDRRPRLLDVGAERGREAINAIKRAVLDANAAVSRTYSRPG